MRFGKNYFVANSIWRDAGLSDSVRAKEETDFISDRVMEARIIVLPVQKPNFVPFFNTRSATYSQAAF